ncbi:MAG TPA: hypothetical protein PKY63_10640, partial [Bacteroidales bacterium]|nr:hypothetical protein [Bacteroidales bacterium]
MSNNNSIRLSCHVLREAGCKEAQKQDPPAGGSNPPVFEKHCFNIFVLFDLSEVVFCLSFTRPFHVKRDTAGRAI